MSDRRRIVETLMKNNEANSSIHEKNLVVMDSIRRSFSAERKLWREKRHDNQLSLTFSRITMSALLSLVR